MFKTIYNRTIYIIYYISKLDWNRFRNYYTYSVKSSQRNIFTLWVDIVYSVYRYNIGLIDYFYFKFYDKNHTERLKWVGTGYKFEYDLVMNPKSERHLLQNKLHFFDAYSPFINHAVCSIEDLRLGNDKAEKVLNNSTSKIAIKDALGQCGWSVEIKEVHLFNRFSLIEYMESKGFNLAEEFIIQHPALSQLSDTGLNTIRIITQINSEGGVDFIGPTLRITVNSQVDNMAMGNIAAPVDINCGQITGPGVYQDIIKRSETHHPVTGVPLIGFQIPFWDEVKALCTKAALHNTKNRSIGWDVAITSKGPSFVEGNHNWCKLLWQLPAGEGLKHVLDGYKKQFANEFR